MDFSPTTLAKVLLPVAPILLKTAVLNTLSLSRNARKQDLRTELTVSVLRELLKKPNPIGKAQKGSLRDPGIKGKMWISKITLPKPEDHEGVTPRDALDMTIKDLGDGSEICTLPETSAVEAEWTGYRSGVDSDAPRPDLSEEEQYQRLMSEAKSKVTVLYFHGGIYVYVSSNPNSSTTDAHKQRNGPSITPPPSLLPCQTDLRPLPLHPLSPGPPTPFPHRNPRRPNRLPVSPLPAPRFLPHRHIPLQHRLRRRQRRRELVPIPLSNPPNPSTKGDPHSPLPRPRRRPLPPCWTRSELTMVRHQPRYALLPYKRQLRLPHPTSGFWSSRRLAVR